eukprot:scaffold33505_cov56-Attheya_sp.AAC.1
MPYSISRTFNPRNYPKPCCLSLSIIRLQIFFVGFAGLNYMYLMAHSGDYFSPLPISLATMPAPATARFEPFDCSKISALPIIQELGVGKQKTVFEVILPSGERAAAKRCSHKECEKQRLLLYEELFYRKLHEKFGDKALAYYGFCQFSSKKTFDPRILTMGSTLFIELGTPALKNWTNWTMRKEELRPKSKEDLESLRDIARQYDTFPGGPLLMHGDNIYPHQYMRNKAGNLRHIDFDMVELMPPPINTTLEENCAVLLGGYAGLIKGDPRLDCSMGYQEQNNDNGPPYQSGSPHPLSAITPLPTTMAFVHIGKTAGSTISKLLRHGCHMFVPHPCKGRDEKFDWDFGTSGGASDESRISQLTSGYYQFSPVPVDKHDGYMISTRNPIDRVVSAFLYVHPSNIAVTTSHRAKWLKAHRGQGNAMVEEYDKFYECFGDIRALAALLVGDGECAKLGRHILGGGSIEGEMLNHFGYNYHFYANNLLRSGSRIFVLRQEHLAGDWSRFNVLLGGLPHELSGMTKDFKDELTVKLPPNGLSKEERQSLCTVLSEEINVYLAIVEAAENLTEGEKKESRQEILEWCSSLGP